MRKFQTKRNASVIGIGYQNPYIILNILFMVHSECVRYTIEYYPIAFAPEIR